MRTQNGLILFILTVILMSGTLMFQYTDNSLNESELTREVEDTTGYKMGGSNSDSFNRWLPERAIQDFMKKARSQVEDQHDLSTRSSSAYNQLSANQIVDPVVVAFDATHQPIFTEVFQLQNQLSMFGIELIIMWDEFIIPDGVNVLLLSASSFDYAPEDFDQIINWFNIDGPRLLWVAGDSDFSGAFTPGSSNFLLESIGSNLRISGDSVFDDFNNDGAPYRVAAPSPACEGEYSCTFTEGVGSAIFHGPTSVLGYSESAYFDLNDKPLPGVEVVMRASSDAYAVDQDLSGNEFDYYSTNGIVGNYPMMAIQDMSMNKFVIASGEAIFSDYQNMYGMETQQFLNGEPDVWNEGFHEGQLLVDNVFTWFGVNRDLAFDEPIYIFSNEDFVNYGFLGSGIPGDPFVLEGFALTNPNDNLINIFDTDAYFVIRNVELNGLGSWVNGINLGNVRNGLIENNFIIGTGQAISLDHSFNNLIMNNYIDSNGGGVNLWESRDNTVDGNEITNNGWAGISIGNEQSAVWMRFYEDVTATERDAIVWQASFEDPDEGLVWYYHDNLEVSLTLDGVPVHVEVWDVYFDDWAGVWRFDMEFWSEPLPLGIHEFETHFFLEGEEIGSGIGHVTVLSNAIVSIRFWEDATITVGDQIAWQGSYIDPDLALLEEVYAVSEVILTINGELVEVTYSEIYFDEDEYGQYRFDIDFLTDPLDVGEYTFDTQFFEAGVDVWHGSIVVTVLPLSVDDNNYITNNYIINSGQGIGIDNSNSNFIGFNTVENSWENGIGSSQSHRNVFTGNIVQWSNSHGILIGSGNDNQVTGNNVQWNQNGIAMYDGSNNVLMFNNLFQNWGPGFELGSISNTYIAENVISENGWGINLGDSYNTQINMNEISNNFGEGIQINNSPTTRITNNAIYGNWGSGVSGNSESTVSLYYTDSITITDQDSIWWFADSMSDDPDYLQFEHDNLLVELTLDGEPVWVDMSDIWFDDGDGMFRYEIFHHSQPLPVGQHVFQVHFFLDGEFDLFFEAFVDVVVGETSSDDYTITGNYFGNNGWTGVNLGNTDGALIDSNDFENNGGQSLSIGSSTNIIVSNNNIWSESADIGISLWETTHSEVSNNEVSGHWGTAIQLDLSSFNLIENNEIHDNGGGIGLSMSNENRIQFNNIYWNWGDGINLYDSRNNQISNNSIYENGGAGIWVFIENTAYMRFFQDITATDQQSISWQATWFNPTFEEASYYHDNTVVLLTVDGEPVEVELTDIWFDEGDGLFKYDVNYFSNPLPVGDHEFEVQFILDGQVDIFTAIVTVIATEPGSDKNWITNNYIGSNDWIGIGLHQSSGGLIDTNTIEGNGGDGVFLQGSTLVEITKNVIQSNANGILLVGSSENYISNNEVFNSDAAGIVVLFDSNENVITYNIVHDLGDDGMGGWDSHGNLLAFNEIFNVDDAILFRFSNNNIITENYLHDNRNRGVFLTTEPFEPVQMRFFEHITVTDDDSIFWQATSVADDLDYLQFEHDNILVELTVDGEPVWVELSDIWFDEWDGLWKYDINYFSEPLSIGEHLFHVRFFLEGWFEFETTAVVNVVPNEATSSGNVISKNVITDTEFNGIHLTGSDGNTISKNEITRNGFGAIALFDSHDNTIKKNLAYDHGLGIIYLSSSDRNKISNNELSNGYSGVYLSSSNENVIMKNEISNNLNSGIELHESYSNSVLKNELENNELGIYLEFSDNNKLIRNELEENFYGISLSNSDNNKLSRNEFEINFAGMVLEFSNYNKISRNEYEENGYGLALIYSNDNSVKRNEFEENGVAIFSFYSYDNSYSHNEFEDNSEDFVIFE